MPGPAGEGEDHQLGRESSPFDRLDLQLGLAHLRLGRHRLPRFRRLERQAAGVDRLLGVIGPQGEAQSGQASEDREIPCDRLLCESVMSCDLPV